MKKYKIDFLLIILLVAMAVISYVFIYVFNDDEASCVKVTVDGRDEVTLDIDEDTEYTVNTKQGTNIIRISDGNVSVIEADCPDELCRKQGTISKSGETIICLPHKVVVTICGKDNNPVDAIVR